jgi:serine O-acetyltransferase
VTQREAWRADLRRYPPRPFLREQSVWAVAVMRYGQWVDSRPQGLAKRMLLLIYWASYRVVETMTGISLPKEAAVGPGLRIHHFGGIVVHPRARIGGDCTLRHGVTIGTRDEDGPAPTVGDGVEFGAYAQVLGGITIGNAARIGALCVVVDDVAAGGAVAGVAARPTRSRAPAASTRD